MDCSLPGSFVHGIVQARILQWVAISSSKGSPQPRDLTHFSCGSYIGRQILHHLSHLEALESVMLSEISQTQKEKYYIISLTCGI